MGCCRRPTTLTRVTILCLRDAAYYVWVSEDGIAKYVSARKWNTSQCIERTGINKLFTQLLCYWCCSYSNISCNSIRNICTPGSEEQHPPISLHLIPTWTLLPRRSTHPPLSRIERRFVGSFYPLLSNIKTLPTYFRCTLWFSVGIYNVICNNSLHNPAQ